jgi:hypothetical protein
MRGPRSTDIDAARVEALRRDRERMFREELSIEGYFQDKRPKAAK